MLATASNGVDGYGMTWRGEASHTVTLRGGSSEAIRGDEGKEVDCKCWYSTGSLRLASHTALFLERGSEAVLASVWRCSSSTGFERLHTSRITVRDSEAGNGTEEMAPEVLAWARNRSGKVWLYTLRIFWCAVVRPAKSMRGRVASGGAETGVDSLGIHHRQKCRKLCWEWPETVMFGYASH